MYVSVLLYVQCLFCRGHIYLHVHVPLPLPHAVLVCLLSRVLKNCIISFVVIFRGNEWRIIINRKSTHDQRGDTDSVEDEDEDEEENMSQSTPSSQVPPLLPAVSSTETWKSNLKANQLIVKGVFSCVLNREEMIDVLKKKVLY